MLLRNLRIVTPAGMIENGLIFVANGKIDWVGDEKEFVIKESINGEASTEKAGKSLKGLTVFPGFIDVHIHGSNGYDTMDTVKVGAIAIKKMAEGLIKSGVTSFLATTVSAEAEKLKIVEREVEKARVDFLKAEEQSSKGDFATAAEVLGIHLEGPYINPLAKGAQNGEFIRKPDFDMLEGLGESTKIITLAPEEDHDFEFTKRAVEKGIVISAGHSKAGYKQGISAFDAGISGVTHLFNGMTPLHHRDPGVAGAGLDDERVYVEIIADLIHLHPAILRLVKKTKGSKKIMLVTDAMQGQGMEPGEYELGGLKVIVDKDSARLQDGTLAGSILTMDKALQNMKEVTDASLLELADMTSGNQARLLKLTDRGTIEAGKKADLVFLDEDFNVSRVMKNGKFVEIKVK